MKLQYRYDKYLSFSPMLWKTPHIFILFQLLSIRKAQSSSLRNYVYGIFHILQNVNIVFHHAQAAQSYPVLLITLYLYINSILKIIRKSCVINLLRYIFI
jgi:hypothetical protein